MAKPYARGTEVSVAKTKAELEELLRAHGAKATAVYHHETGAAIAFEMHDRRIIMKLPLPSPGERRFSHWKQPNGFERLRTPESARELYEQGCRERWRALFLAVKAKLVSVQQRIETFEEAFMAHVQMPDGRTIGEYVKPRLAQAYKENRMVALLPGPDANG
jgi:hypothetical protein